MEQKKEDIKLLKKQIGWLSKQIQNYNYALKAGAIADDYLLKQNVILLKLADNIMISCKEFQADIDKMNKDFARRK